MSSTSQSRAALGGSVKIRLYFLIHRPTGCYMWLHVGLRKEKVRRAFAMLIGIGYTGNASLFAYFRLGVRVS
jgi:hypothetical protein